MLSRMRLSLCSPDLPTPAISLQRRKSDSSICGSRGLLSHSHLRGRMAVKCSVLSERWSTAFCDSAVWGQTPPHAPVRPSSSGQWLGALSEAQPLAGEREKTQNCSGKGLPVQTQAAESTVLWEPFVRAQPMVWVRTGARCSLWHCV